MTYDTYLALMMAVRAIEEFDLSERDTSEVCAIMRSELRQRKEARDMDAWRSQKSHKELSQ